MPRKARIDAPGALQHIIVRGINLRKIFFDDSDRDDFLDRLGGILPDSKTPCFGKSTKNGTSSERVMLLGDARTWDERG